MKILVTGAAGFIGFHTAKRLLERGDEVIGVDNLNDYYEVTLKESRLEQLSVFPGFTFVCHDVAHRQSTARLFMNRRPERVIHLAAQAGVRHSITNPHAYADSNLVGFLNVLEGCRHGEVEHLVYASSSSVYGGNKETPFSIRHNVDHPLSLYAATKKANELMAYTYSHLYTLPVTGLRFFTVYGPWGRPDMAYFIFARAIEEGTPIDVYNHGKMRRDFTYIDDIVEGVVRVCDKVASPVDVGNLDDDANGDRVPYRLYNIGNQEPVDLMEFIECLEDALGQEAVKNYLPMQPGDVTETFADVEELARDVGFRPATPLAKGIRAFVEWYRDYYGSSVPRNPVSRRA